MQPTPMRAVARNLGVGAAIVISVSFMTVAFSFLGTILCAVAIGMMTGAARHSRWQAGAVSLVFPAAVLTLLGSMKTESPGDRVYSVALLCFAAFWVTYAVTAAVMHLERKAPSDEQPKTLPVAAEKRRELAVGDCPQPETSLDSYETGGTEKLVELSLERLYGHWICREEETSCSRTKEMEITDGRLAVSGSDEHGRERWVARGRFRIEGAGCKEVVLLNGRS
jgi:hypothetical protein